MTLSREVSRVCATFLLVAAEVVSSSVVEKSADEENDDARTEFALAGEENGANAECGSKLHSAVTARHKYDAELLTMVRPYE